MFKIRMASCTNVVPGQRGGNCTSHSERGEALVNFTTCLQTTFCMDGGIVKDWSEGVGSPHSNWELTIVISTVWGCV